MDGGCLDRQGRAGRGTCELSACASAHAVSVRARDGLPRRHRAGRACSWTGAASAMGPLSIARRRPPRTHSAPPGALPPPLVSAHGQRRALQLNERGAQLRRSGDAEQATEQHRVALEIARDLDAPVAQALTLSSLGLALAQGGSDEAAVRHFEEALTVLRELGEEEHAGPGHRQPRHRPPPPGPQRRGGEPLNSALDKLSARVAGPPSDRRADPAGGLGKPLRGTILRVAQTEQERLRALFDAVLAVSSELSLDAVLQRIVEAAAELTGAGVLIQDTRPLRLAEIGDEPRSVGFPPNHPPMHVSGVPILQRGVAYGNLYLTEISIV